MAGSEGYGLGEFTAQIAKFLPLGTEAKTIAEGLTGGIKGLVDTMAEGARTVEGYRISLNLAAGATSDFTAKLRQEAYSLNEYGVSFSKLVDINVKIAESYSRATFSAAQTREQFESERQEVQKLIAVNEKFNVDSGTTVQLLNRLGNSVFTSTSQVSAFSDTLLRFSKETGQPFKNVLSEFDSYYQRFVTSLDSNKATQSFTTLETLARRAGTSVSTLVGSISKFDDIDEAFSTGGQINRVLSQFGGSFDTLAAANASEEEKAQMLLQSISEIKDRFNTTMTNPNARRQVLKEMASQTGLPIETIAGLLKDGQDLSKDLQSIIKTPTVTGIQAIPDEEKKKMALDVTKLSDVEEIAKENIKIGPLTLAMEKMITNQKQMILSTTAELGSAVDKSFAKVLAGKSDVLTFLGDLGKAAEGVEKKLKQSDVVEKILGGDLTHVPAAIAESFKKNIGGVAGDKVQEAYNEHIKKLAVKDAERERKDDERRKKDSENMFKTIKEANEKNPVKVFGTVVVTGLPGGKSAMGTLTQSA